MGGLWTMYDHEGREVASRWSTYADRTAAADVSLAVVGRSVFAEAVPFRHLAEAVGDLPIGCGRLYLTDRVRALFDRVSRVDPDAEEAGVRLAAEARIAAACGIRHPIARRVYGRVWPWSPRWTAEEIRGGLSLLLWTREHAASNGVDYLEWS